MAKYTNRVTQYWQNKRTAHIIEIFQEEDYKQSPEWNLEFRRVRLLHHPESECVFAEDYGVCLSALDDPLVIEIDLKEYNYLNMVYSNPDI